MAEDIPNGLSIINHVYEKAKSAKIGDVFVATGDEKIFEEVTKKGGKCVLTTKEHQTGTDRIFEAIKKKNNIDQYDLPVQEKKCIYSGNPAKYEVIYAKAY